MTREDYILIQARELSKLAKRRKKLFEKSMDSSGMTQKSIQKLHTEMNWEGMNYSMTEERLGFALGHLTLDNLRDFYEPSAWNKYKGIREEMEKLKFDK
jgi:hypothetical protein